MDNAAAHRECLSPTVRIGAMKGSSGSGLIVYSKTGSNGLADTYVLTNYHVIAPSLELKNTWCQHDESMVLREIRHTCEIEIFLYNQRGKCIGINVRNADIVVYDDDVTGDDLAILRIKDEHGAMPNVVRLPSESDLQDVSVFDNVIAVGCAAGHTPFATRGEVTYMMEEIDGKDYIMISSPIYYGSSGGGVFKEYGGNQYKCIGIVSKVQTPFDHTSPGAAAQVISHMGYAISMERVYNFLKDSYMHYVFDQSFTKTQCDEMLAADAEKMR